MLTLHAYHCASQKKMLLLKMLRQVPIGTKRNRKKSHIVYYVTLYHAPHANGTLAMFFFFVYNNSCIGNGHTDSKNNANIICMP